MGRVEMWRSVLCAVCLSVTMSLGAVNVDPNGYVAYCPCMGRFGNQADQFLGALGFAQALNRTLLLPAWVEYKMAAIKSVQVPFDVYFKVDPLRDFHRAMTMETFMKDLAPTIWPKGKRIAFCYSSRPGAQRDQDGCNAKEGNPFGSFWDTYDVDFDGSLFFQPLYYSTDSPREMRRWAERFPPADYPVLAFTGPPAAFPVQEQHVRLQRYLRWSDAMEDKARQFIDDHVKSAPFLGLHLRNGIDFKKACEHIKTSPNMFAAPQCLGYRGQFGSSSYAMCYPDDGAVVQQVKKEVKRMGARTVFVATDHRDLISEFSKEMKNVQFVRQPSPADPMVDLAILGQADHFIGNCISSFTAFVKRARDAAGRTSSFWSFSPKRPPPQRTADEREDL